MTERKIIERFDAHEYHAWLSSLGLMTEHEIVQKLDELAEVQAAQDAIRLAKKDRLAELLTAEQRQQFADIEAEAALRLADCSETEQQLVEIIKAATLETRQSVRGRRLQAIWQKGRISWDTQALDGFAVAYPDVNRFREEGQPSVSIRTVK